MSFEELDRELRDSTASEVKRPRIVVVDDDDALRESLLHVLSERYNTIACASAQEGVDAIDEEVCAVILDVKMGKHDGFWACDRIRHKFPDIPVIFYSAYQNFKDPYEIINQHKPFGYITKSDDTKRLLDAVETAVTLYTKILEGKKLVEAHRKRIRQDI